MDARTPDHLKAVPSGTADEDFLLREGLELLANYRAIGDDAVRLNIRKLIASLAGRDLP